ANNGRGRRCIRGTPGVEYGYVYRRGAMGTLPTKCIRVRQRVLRQVRTRLAPARAGRAANLEEPSMNDRQPGLQTRAIHAGAPTPRIGGAVNVPIFQSSVFEQARAGAYHDIVYPRLSTTPTHLALGRKLAALEGADLAFATSSGMAAITT